MTIGIDTGLGDPFFSGSGPGGADNPNLPVSLDGRGYIVDLSTQLSIYHRYQRSSIQLTNSQQGQTGGDNAQVPPEIWRRPVEDWSAGDGQSRYDRDKSMSNRFNDSHNIDVWDPWHLKLLPGVTKLHSLAAGRSFLVTVGLGRMIAITGTTGYWMTDLTGAVTTETFSSAVLDACSDGTNLYVLLSTGVIKKYTAPATSTTYATIGGWTGAAVLLRYVKGFLIAADGPKLYDVSTGTPVLVYSHPLASWTWVDACDGLGNAYLLGGTGDKWLVMRTQVASTGSTLDPPITAATLAAGAVGYALGGYLGFVTVGTSKGFQFGISSADGSLVLGRLVQTGCAVRCFEGQDRFVWYGQSATSATPTAGLGRMDLSQFIDELTPASARDLSTTVVTGEVRAVTTFSATATSRGKRVFTVDGDGVYAETDNLAASGWLTQGLMTFGSTDTKMGVYLQLFHDPLSGQIDVQVAYDDLAPFEVGINNQNGSTSMGNMQLRHPFHTAEITYNLTADAVTPTLGPVINRVEMRAMPVSGRASEWRLPILLFDDIDWENWADLRDTGGDYQHLISLIESRVPFAFRENSLDYTVYATDFLFWPHHVSGDGKTYQGTFIMVVREIV